MYCDLPYWLCIRYFDRYWRIGEETPLLKVSAYDPMQNHYTSNHNFSSWSKTKVIKCWSNRILLYSSMIWPNSSIWPLVTIGHTIKIINLLVAFHGSTGYLVKLRFPGFLVISPKYGIDDLFLKHYWCN